MDSKKITQKPLTLTFYPLNSFTCLFSLDKPRPWSIISERIKVLGNGVWYPFLVSYKYPLSYSPKSNPRLNSDISNVSSKNKRINKRRRKTTGTI